jgi:hypothetical protein
VVLDVEIDIWLLGHGGAIFGAVGTPDYHKLVLTANRNQQLAATELRGLWLFRFQPDRKSAFA